jgi:hypothetical protein
MRTRTLLVNGQMVNGEWVSEIQTSPLSFVPLILHSSFQLVILLTCLYHPYQLINLSTYKLINLLLLSPLLLTLHFSHVGFASFRLQLELLVFLLLL